MLRAVRARLTIEGSSGEMYTRVTLTSSGMPAGCCSNLKVSMAVEVTPEARRSAWALDRVRVRVWTLTGRLNP